MKKLSLLLIVCSFFAATTVFGQQWNGANNSTSSIYRNGNVGLGMPYPTSQLHIHGISSNATFALESTAGKYVISTNTQGYFDVDYAIPFGGMTLAGKAISIGRFGGDYWVTIDMLQRTKFSNDVNFQAQSNFNATSIFNSTSIFNNVATFNNKAIYNGNVGIATTNPQKRLHVQNGDILIQNGRLLLSDGNNQIELKSDGLIHAREIEVDLVLIPDYVFADNYELMPLTELQKFIDSNHHLPNIKSAEEYEAHGSIPLKELNIKLLEKVEELTLYTLEQQTEIENLKKQMLEMQNALKVLAESDKKQ
jgi:hypothetical protein